MTLLFALGNIVPRATGLREARTTQRETHTNDVVDIIQLHYVGPSKHRVHRVVSEFMEVAAKIGTHTLLLLVYLCDTLLLASHTRLVDRAMSEAS